MKQTFLLFILALLFSCAENNKKADDSNIVEVEKLNVKNGFTIPKRFLDSVRYVKLTSEDDDLLIGKIAKVEIQKDKIYILDNHNRKTKLVVFDQNGKAIAQVGKRGQGPNEYLQIGDFDVDTSGNVYFIDGRLDKFFVYDKDFNIKSTTKLPFEADIIKILGNGNYLWGLSSWNQGQCANDKVIVTNKDLQPLDTLCQYDEYRDDNFWISSYDFVETEKYITYNQTISNDVLLLNKQNGKLIKTIEFDFGSKNVPDEKKKNIESHLNDFKSYNMLQWITIVEDDYILGTFWDRTESKPFFIDRQKNDIHIGKSISQYRSSTVKAYKNKVLISYIEPDSEQAEDDKLPKEVRNHLENGDFVLAFSYLK